MPEPITIDGKYLIGHKEKVEFPDFKRRNIVARVDSGALSTSVHCDRIWVETLKGKKVLCCHLLKRSRKVTRFSHFSRKRIKSSNGSLQMRYVVNIRIRLGEVEKVTPVSLSDRSTMNHSVLLGRRFLRQHFVIDVSKKYLLSSS